MIENLLFSLNRVMPYFLLIVLGVIFRKSGVVPKSFFEGANLFTFKIALPFQLFLSISAIERGGGGGSFMLYVLVLAIGSFLVIWLITELVYKDKTLVGTLVQGAYRSNFVLLGVPLAYSVLGEPAVKIASLATAVLVPANAIPSIFVLALRGKSQERISLSGVMKSIVLNPLVIGISCGLPFMFFNIKIPAMIGQTMTFIGQTATPLGLLSIGGMLNLAHATARIRPAIFSAMFRIIFLPVAVMALSYFLGYRDGELLILLIFAAAPTAVSSYAMASEMGGDAALASNIMIITTFASAFVLAFGIYILKTLSLI